MALDREKTLQAAQKHVDRRKYDRALQEYQKVVAADPKDTRTLLKIGDVQARSGDFTGAIRTYDSVAEFYTHQGFSLKAIAVYKQIRELVLTHVPKLAPDYGHIVERLSELYVGLGLINDALSALDAEATRLREEDKESEAVAIYRRMADVGRAVPISHLRLAEGLCRVGQVDEAMNSFWSAAELLIQGGRKPDALRVIERMLHFKPQPRAAKLAARLYLEQDSQPEAMQALSRLQLCFQANPKDIETLQLLAQAFNLLGQEDKSLEVQKEIARQAHEQGRPSVFERSLAKLTAAAPEDDQVVALSQMPPPLSSKAPLESPKAEGSSNAADALQIPPPPAQPTNTDDAAPHKSPPGPPPRRAGGVERAQGGDPAESGDVLDELDVELLQSDAPSSIAPPALVQAAPSDLSAEQVQALTSKALIEAQTFRDLGQYNAAIAAVQEALTHDPRSIELREMVRDLYAESGDRDRAIDEMLTMVAIYTEYGRPDHARSVLLNILEAEPEHKVARHTLGQLEESFGAAAPAPRYSLQPSYALASSHPPSERAKSEPPDPQQSSAAPLPRFEIEGEVDDAQSERGPEMSEEAPADGAALGDAEAQAARPRSNPAGRRGVEDALEEADFYSSRAMFEDARLIIADQLKEHPNHPLLLENLEEIENAIKRNAAQESSDEPDFDLGASLSELARVVRESQAPPPAGEPSQSVDVDAVFAKFKEGVRNQISDGDAATHYDLGVAYREMNLIDDAISELELAAQDPARECTCHSMVANLHLKQGRLDDARASLERALQAGERTSAQEAAVHYDLGNVAELQDRTEAAIYHFSEVDQRDGDFRDTADRLERLRVQTATAKRSAAKDEEDVDRAFQELIGE